MRVARPVRLDENERLELVGLVRQHSLPTRLLQRAEIVLLADAGLQDQQIALELRITPAKAARWRNRYLDYDRRAIEKDAARLGKWRTLNAARVAEVIRKTTQERPPGAARWSTRKMAAATGLSEASVRRIWHANSLAPHRVKTLPIPKDPHFAQNLNAVLGLYLDPPEHAIVLCTSEGRLDGPGPAGHNDERNGTITFFAAINALDETLTGTPDDWDRHKGWLEFLRAVEEAAPPETDLYLIADNANIHEYPKVQRWLSCRPWFHIHLAPAGSSWLDTVERFLLDAAHQRPYLGVLRDAQEIILAIGRHIVGHDSDSPRPFVWTQNRMESFGQADASHGAGHSAAARVETVQAAAKHA